MYNRTFKYYLTFIAFICIWLNANAVPPPPEEMPIDGGISLLIAAGLAYGGKKAYDKHKSDL